VKKSFGLKTIINIFPPHNPNRVELQKLMIDAVQRKFEIVLIKSVSRWARDTVDSILLVRKLMSFGIRVMSVEDNFDSFDDGAEFKLAIYSALAQQESDTISKRVKFGIAVKSREGKFHGSLPPYGYEKVKGKLELHPIHLQTVRLIFNLYLREGWGMQKIANYLTAKKTPYPSGGSWSQKCRGQMAILNGEIDSNQSSLYGRFGTGPFQDGNPL
jgi:site-specific DNA recombinase